MTINPAIAATAPSFHPEPHGAITDNWRAPKLGPEGGSHVAIDDCGTKVPGFPPRPHHLEGALHSRLDQVALNPQPLPPKESPFAWMDRIGIGQSVSHQVMNALAATRASRG